MTKTEIKEIYKDLPEETLIELDYIIEMMADSTEKIDKLKEIIKEEGDILYTPGGRSKINPMCAELRKEKATFLNCFKQLKFEINRSGGDFDDEGMEEYE